MTQQINPELRRDLLEIASICTAAAELAGLIPADTLEGVVAEIAMLGSRAHRGLIDRLVADAQCDVTKIIVTGTGARSGKGMLSGAR